MIHSLMLISVLGIRIAFVILVVFNIISLTFMSLSLVSKAISQISLAMNPFLATILRVM